MNEPQASQSLPGTRIHCRETDGQLVLYLPACPRLVLRRFSSLLVLFVFLVGFFLVSFYLLDGFLPPVLALGSVEVIIFLAALAAMAAPYLKTTFILITRNRAVLKTVLYGKEQVREYALNAQSRARQWYLPPRLSDHKYPHRSGPEGIEIGSDPYDPEVGSDVSDESKPRFGAGLSPGELDWVEWRINRFFDKATTGTAAIATRPPAPVRIEGLPEKPVSCPEHTKVRIVEDPFEFRIHFPNTVESRSFSGTGSVLIGLGVLVYPLFVLLQWAAQKEGWRPPEIPAIFVLAVLSLLGLAGLLKGLTRLFGRRELRITPETITYRTTLFGLGLPLRLPTAQVASVGLPRDGGRRRRTRHMRSVAPATGSVIRTAERELNYSEAVSGLPEEETQWIIAEVARCIDAARSGDR